MYSDSVASRDFTEASPGFMRRRKIVKKGFSLGLMVCGRSGTGKSTFVNTLCDGSVFPENSYIPSTREMEIHTRPVQLAESDGTTITLTIVDTPGFGDNINNNSCCAKIVSYLERQFDAILEDETKILRKVRTEDKRVHACLYFISATDHGLQELDIDLMKQLSSRVNVIPVIAKADTFTKEELLKNKKLIMEDIRTFDIPIYSFPCDDSDDIELIEECMGLRELVPFSVIGGNSVIQKDGEIVRARVYPWGSVEVEDPECSDFVTLRSVLFGSHLQELRDITHEQLYENYRAEKLTQMERPNSSEVHRAPGVTVIAPKDNPFSEKLFMKGFDKLMKAVDKACGVAPGAVPGHVSRGDDAPPPTDGGGSKVKAH